MVLYLGRDYTITDGRIDYTIDDEIVYTMITQSSIITDDYTITDL